MIVDIFNTTNKYDIIYADPPGNINRVVQLNIPGVWLNGITRL